MTGEIDRKTLGELVFGNDNRLKELHDLVRPRILQSLDAFHKKRLRNMERMELWLWKLLSSSRLGGIICAMWCGRLKFLEEGHPTACEEEELHCNTS